MDSSLLLGGSIVSELLMDSLPEEPESLDAPELPDPLLLEPVELPGSIDSSLDEGSLTRGSDPLLSGGSLLDVTEGVSLLLRSLDDKSLPLDEPLE